MGGYPIKGAERKLFEAYHNLSTDMTLGRFAALQQSRDVEPGGSRLRLGRGDTDTLAFLKREEIHV